MNMDKEKSVTIASVLGLLGGVLLLYGAILPIITALGHDTKVSEIWQMRHLNLIFLMFVVVIIFGIIGIIGAIKARSKNKTAENEKDDKMKLNKFPNFTPTLLTTKSEK